MSSERKHFDIGAEVLFYDNGERVYGWVWNYPADDDKLITIEVLNEDDSVARYVTMDEMYVRDHDDPDDPEDDN